MNQNNTQQIEAELKNLESMRREFASVARKSTTTHTNPDKEARKTLKARRNHLPSTPTSSKVMRSDIFSHHQKEEEDNQRHSALLALPDCALENVLRFFSYEELAGLRIVCRKLNVVCGRQLNQGFRRAERFHAKCMREMKAKLPRRESERRNHPMSRHCDILTAIETRISLLAMTFMKFVDVNLCCFIPGRVIDEIFKVLRTLKKESQPPRAFEILQELRDISSMAMEYFDEKIVPTFKLGNSSPGSVIFATPKYPSSSNYLSGLPSILTSSSLSSLSSSSSSSPLNMFSSQTYAERLVISEKNSRVLARKLKRSQADSKKVFNEQKLALQDQGVKISSLEKLIGSQQLIISQMNERIKQVENLLDLSPKTEQQRQPPDEAEVKPETEKPKARGASKRKNTSEYEIGGKKRK